MFALPQFRMHTGHVVAVTHEMRCLLRERGIDRRMHAVFQLGPMLDDWFARASSEGVNLPR
jgi:hypothetical protein